MLRRFFDLFSKLFRKVYAVLNHVGYAKHIGVNMKGRTFIYGNPYKMFSTEPWCVTLGDNVHITNDVVFVCHDGGTLLFRHLVPDLEITKPIRVGNNVFIGTRSTIMPGVTIGDNVIVAAGSIVSRDLPSNGVYGGVPAKLIKPIDEYFRKIQQESLHLGHLKGKEKDRELRKILLKQN